MQLAVRRELLKKIMEEKGWSKKRFAVELEINYSYFYRILNGERNPGSKFISGFLKFCRENGLSFEEYVYINLAKK